MYVCNDYMETVLGTGDPQMTREKVYSISQLKDAKDFMKDNTSALLLKQAVMCWSENSGKKQSGLSCPSAARQFWFTPMCELCDCWLVKTQVYSYSIIEPRGFGILGWPKALGILAK